MVSYKLESKMRKIQCSPYHKERVSICQIFWPFLEANLDYIKPRLATNKKKQVVMPHPLTTKESAYIYHYCKLNTCRHVALLAYGFALGSCREIRIDSKS